MKNIRTMKWDLTGREEELVRLIVLRAVALLKLDRTQIEMDIVCVHVNTLPLDLEKLLGFDDFNFMHDVGGIRINLDRQTGELNHFLPKCYKQKKIDLSKTIGLVRYLDGTYRPSNERQQQKLDDLFKKGPFFHSVDHAAPPVIKKSQMDGLRDMAKQHGYKIVTSIKALAVALVLAFTLFAGRANAWECPRNPDRFPSIGIAVSNLSVHGTRYEIDQPGESLSRVHSGPEKQTGYRLGADIRLPVNNQITLGLFYSEVDASRRYDRTNGAFTSGQTMYTEKIDMTGQEFGMNLRLYFSK